MNVREQLSFYRTIFQLSAAANRSARDFLRPDLENARVKLGTSLADYSLPYVLYPDLPVIMELALKELAYLFLYRNKTALGEESDAFLMMDHRSTADLRPRSFAAPAALKNPELRTLLMEAPRLMFLLDTGIMESWLGSSGRGRLLMETFSRLYNEAADEMAARGEKEETPYLLAWALLNAFPAAVKVAEWLPVEPKTKKTAANVLLLGLHLVHRYVIEQLLSLRKGEFPPGSRVAVCMGSLFGLRTAFFPLQNNVDFANFYDIPAALLGERRMDLLKRVGKKGDVSALEKGIVERLEGDGKLRAAAITALRTSAFRRAALDLLGAGLPLDSVLFQKIEAWMLDPAAFDTMLKKGRLRKEAAALVKTAAKEFSDNPPLAKKLDEFHQLFKRWSFFNPLKPLGLKTEEALKIAGEQMAADLVESYLSGGVREILVHHQPRSGQESDMGLDDQYSAGRLYRFGSVPILNKAMARGSAAHYFIDLKDYTARTALLKEEVMANFIREEFYEPILNIARSKFQGLAASSDRGGIYLNNLLGDAVSISGDITVIVEMAREIRRHLERYAAILQRRQEREDIAGRIKEIKDRYGRLIEENAAELKTAGLPAEKAAELRDREGALRRDMERELDGLTGQHLISGSFISYGAAANVITFNDTLWGSIKVSICEKINESARGTARPGGIIAAVNQLLELERRRLNRPALRLPFDLYVGNTLGLPLAPEVELSLRHAFSTGKAQDAYKLYLHAAQSHIKKTLSGGRLGIRRYLQRGMGIYNAGDGLTGEALEAYQKGYRNLTFVDVSLPVKEIDEEIRNTFAFFKAALRLLVGVNANRQICQLFHYAGAVTFKGFESAPPSEIWEIIDMEKDFGRMMGDSAGLHAAIRDSLG